MCYVSNSRNVVYNKARRTLFLMPVLEPESAGLGGGVFFFRAGVLAAVEGAEPVDGADGLAMLVELKEGAFAGEMTAGAASFAGAAAVLGDGQYGSDRALDLGLQRH